MRSLLLSLFMCIYVVTYAQNERFKSLYVLHFTKNIEWPSNYTEGDFIITVLGNSPMYTELQKNLKGKQMGSQIIDVTQVSNISGIKKCHILYIPAQQSNLLDAAQKYIAGKPTLIVTEKRGLIVDGADINIVSHAGGKLQFELRPKQIAGKRLKVSKTLLDLGIVYDDNATTRKTPELESVDDTNLPR